MPIDGWSLLFAGSRERERKKRRTFLCDNDDLLDLDLVALLPFAANATRRGCLSSSQRKTARVLAVVLRISGFLPSLSFSLCLSLSLSLTHTHTKIPPLFLQHPFPSFFLSFLPKKKKKQIASLKPALKAELKNELTEELSASGALVADAGPEPGPVRWIAEAFSFYRGQTVLLEETLRDTIGGAKAALLEGTLDEGPEWDIGYTSKKRCTDIEGQTKAGQRSCCIPRLQTLTWKDSLAEGLVKQFGPRRAFNITPPSFLIPEQLAEWRNWAKTNEPPGTAWVLKELRHGKVGVTILPFEEATVAAEERGDPDDDDEEDGGGGEPGHRYRVAQRYLKDTMLSSALGGEFFVFVFSSRGRERERERTGAFCF